MQGFVLRPIPHTQTRSFTEDVLTPPENVHLADARRLLCSYAQSGRMRGGSSSLPLPAPAHREPMACDPSPPVTVIRYPRPRTPSITSRPSKDAFGQYSNCAFSLARQRYLVVRSSSLVISMLPFTDRATGQESA